MVSRVFISYRREDAPGHTGRLYDGLASHFGADQVFVDVDNIGIGQDFVARIQEVMSAVDVVVVVIGRGWVDARRSDGHRRLEDPDDFVRLEVETALGRGVLVIPVLVQGAEMPASSTLPPGLKPLARRNACAIDDRDWKHGVERLIRAIDSVIATGTFPVAPAAGVDTPADAAPSTRRAGFRSRMRHVLGWSGRCRRWLRRHRSVGKLLSVVAALFALLVALIIVGLVIELESAVGDRAFGPHHGTREKERTGTSFSV